MNVSRSLKSLESSTSAGGKRKKKHVPPLSIEDIYNQVSNVVASNLNPPPAAAVLTPKSAEICLKHGINPEILKIRDIDSFWEAGIDPAIQGMRHEAYVQVCNEAYCSGPSVMIILNSFTVVTTYTSLNYQLLKIC